MLRLIVTIAAFFCIFLTSCAKSSDISDGDTLDRIRRTGIIDVCTVVQPPGVIKDSKTGAFSGYYVDAMNMIADKINAKIIWHETTWGNATGDLAAKRCDLVAAHFFADIPRSLSVAFTIPPLEYGGLTALVRKGDDRFAHIKNVAELDRPEFTIAVPTGGAGDIFLREEFKKAHVKRVDVEASDISRFCVEVSAKRADVAINDTNTLGLYAGQHPEVVDLFQDHPFSLNPVAWAVRQDDIRWLHFIETALQFLETQGTLSQLEKKYHAHNLHLVKRYKLQ